MSGILAACRTIGQIWNQQLAPEFERGCFLRKSLNEELEEQRGHNVVHRGDSAQQRSTQGSTGNDAVNMAGGHKKEYQRSQVNIIA